MERYDKLAVRVLSVTGNFFEDAPGLIIIMLPEQLGDLLAVDGARAAARAAAPGLVVGCWCLGCPTALWVVAAVASTVVVIRFDFLARTTLAACDARSAVETRALT